MGNVLCSCSKHLDRDKEALLRYVETDENPECFKSSSLNPSRPYYNKQLLDTRMKEIRNSIIYIRENWDKYDELMDELRDALKDDVSVETLSTDIKDLFEKVLSIKRDWESDPKNLSSYEFQVIKLYTSEEGYNSIFKLVNKAFRDDEITNKMKFIRSVVFLVELLNIDLFNYCIKQPSMHNFTGIVYRGLTLDEADLNAFSNLLKSSIPDRYISIPLGLLSSSTTMKIPIEFIERYMEDSKFPLIFQIHVIELRAEFLSLYRNFFPTSVVSSICAVNVTGVSYYPRENEVLLRGPFFQVLRTKMVKKKKIRGKKIQVIDMVMLNTNRDHISTMELGEKSDSARSLFGTMVAIERYEYALRFCEKKSFEDDKAAYLELLQIKKDELKQLTKSIDTK